MGSLFESFVFELELDVVVAVMVVGILGRPTVGIGRGIALVRLISDASILVLKRIMAKK